MHSDRPPLLETPRSYFASAVTPNEAFFVRCHLANIPTEVNLKEWRLNITGHLRGLSVSGVRHGAYSLRIHTLKRF
jgi:DMSO/TMAO reductase YedYZ molybdopterin-dependent catalytic subunit